MKLILHNKVNDDEFNCQNGGYKAKTSIYQLAKTYLHFNFYALCACSTCLVHVKMSVLKQNFL